MVTEEINKFMEEYRDVLSLLKGPSTEAFVAPEAVEAMALDVP